MKKNKQHKNKAKKTRQKSAQRWKKLLQKSAFYIALLSIVIGSIWLYLSLNKTHYDLSVIGNGTPTVVQIHDQNCRLCRQLKTNLDSVKSDFKEDIQFKTANIL